MKKNMAFLYMRRGQYGILFVGTSMTSKKLTELKKNMQSAKQVETLILVLSKPGEAVQTSWMLVMVVLKMNVKMVTQMKNLA